MTELELARRRLSLGSSEIAAVAGLDPYRNAHHIYALKTEAHEQQDNRFMEWGRRLEPMIASKYADDTGAALAEVPQRTHPAYPWMTATPDRLILDASGHAAKVLEIKTANPRQAQYWGEGPDEVPDQYYAQAAWLMAVTDLPACDMAVLLGGNDYRVYTLQRDGELEAELIEIGRRFWFEHVQTKTPPVIDHSEECARALLRRFPRDTAPMRQATVEAEKWAEMLRAAREQVESAEQLKALAEAQLKGIIGDCAGVEGPFGAITWKSSKGRKMVDWEEVVNDLACHAPRDVYSKALQDHTIEKPGPRVLRVNWAK